VSNSIAIKIGIYDFDNDLIEAAKNSDIPQIKIYRPEKTIVVLGKGSNPEKELNLDACLNDGVKILRRHGGGCAVVLDPGNVIVSLAFKAPGIGQNNKYFKIISDWLIAGLDKTGIKGVCHDGISDLVINDKKIAGSCIYRTKGLLYYSATILFQPDFRNIEKYLKHPPREPEYRKSRRHTEFLTCLCPGYFRCSIEEFTEKLSLSLDPASLNQF
jgi:lipoate---protein ligase